MQVVDYVQIVENIEDRLHKQNCERAFTLAYKHYNCVMTINMQSEKSKPVTSENAPIMVSNLDTNILEPFGAPIMNQDDQAHPSPEVVFTQNTVPFDFDGDRLLWMNYQSRDLRDLNLYNFP